MYTSQELNTMQKWSLDRKIQVTQARLIEWYKYYNGKVYQLNQKMLHIPLAYSTN